MVVLTVPIEKYPDTSASGNGVPILRPNRSRFGRGHQLPHHNTRKLEPDIWYLSEIPFVLFDLGNYAVEFCGWGSGSAGNKHLLERTMCR